MTTNDDLVKATTKHFPHGSDTGRTLISWEHLAEYDGPTLTLILEAIIEDGAARGLLVQYCEADGGILVRWRPRRRS